jgi:hypothetical protein
MLNMPPPFPTELERYIFETAAKSFQNRKKTLPLLLVARRVQTWIEPLIYKQLHISNKREAQSTLDRILTGPDVLRHTVTKLALDDDYPRQPMLKQIEPIFAACPNLTHLSLSRDNTWVVLERLEDVKDDTALPPVLPHLTHLVIDFSFFSSRFKLRRYFANLPALTHLALVCGFYGSPFVDILESAMQTYARLEVLLLSYEDGEELAGPVESLRLGPSLPIYFLRFRDFSFPWWDDDKGEDIWSKAEHYSIFRC